MRSPLGVGASRFHTGGEAGAVDTVYLGVFQRQALIAIGGFDERFTRAQDWELNYRLRSNGGTIYFDPRLEVTYRPRPNLTALAKQYFEYGRWRRVVSRRHQGTINYRYLAPPLALSGFLISLICGALLHPILYLPALIYGLFVPVASIAIARSITQFIYLLAVIPTMHFAWGAGFITSPKNLVPAER
jgi:GT2 family glycosyltransferase